MVRGWSEEASIETFVEDLKPWLFSVMKLRQLQNVLEAMRMAELIEESSSERRRAKKSIFSTSKGANPKY